MIQALPVKNHHDVCSLFWRMEILRKRQPELVDAPNENHPPLIILSIIFKEKIINFKF